MTGPMPVTLVRARDTDLETLRTSPQRTLSVDQRKELIAAFGPEDDPTADNAPVWLSIMAGRKVVPIFEVGVLPLLSAAAVNNQLPVFLNSLSAPADAAWCQQTIPEEELVPLFRRQVRDTELPRFYLGVAEEIVGGRVSVTSEAVRALGEFSYYATADSWFDGVFDGDTDLWPNTEWQDIDAAYRAGIMAFAEHFGTFGSGADDAAQSAAMAISRTYHWDEEEEDWIRKVDSDKLVAFWEWWLLQAIPDAWQTALAANAEP